MIAAAGLDRLIGDPLWSPHPVVWMGRCISTLRRSVEHWSGGHPRWLRLGGLAITLVLTLGSASIGWLIERMALQTDGILQSVALLALVAGLASALAAKSLEQSVLNVIAALPREGRGSLSTAREQLSWIVGRDTTSLSGDEILRATAETASENAVDGLFAPLFWMLAGAALWSLGLSDAPGPLALAWGFKAASTLDSMLGYRRGTLRWLGTAGARLDDLLTWLPCRLVMLSLPLVSMPWRQWPALIRSAESEGQLDASPNAGRSEAIYAHCAGVQLGGRNRYGDHWVEKPLLGADQPNADPRGISRILELTRRLELLWILMAAMLSWSLQARAQ
ncbi:adenosylcobinamide-phosphate synthase CbiB [Synechococcus sp. MIT S9508]|uniref:adenosylcobinamide-phosphate synthase CbiB n=1 Tax=Synechococcus sp. MIT S9508 TaxID=1801629 RepID=UPI0007BC7259|nr:adenosylcobinamide-phosphate synthase CbiB [Synechococcus sp. MIT S9508]KZR89978.1 Cobalamin biosynthesis protein CbiB [Synechococcus sp. MIT S9508]